MSGAPGRAPERNRYAEPTHLGEDIRAAERAAARACIERSQLEGLAWQRIACALDAENRQLRGWLTDLIVWLWQREELRAFIEATIERRWPEGGSDG